MLSDLVVDTKVFVHASNPGQRHHSSSVEFLRELRNCGTVLRIDPTMRGGRKAASLIMKEYAKHIRPTMMAYHVLCQLASTGRLVPVGGMPDLRTRRAVCRLVSNTRDRTFLLVSIVSGERTLTSHDYEDFPITKRKTIKARFSTIVEAADETSLRLS